MPSFFNADEINGRFISVDGSTLDTHVASNTNPHAVNFSDILSSDPTLSADFGLYNNKIINLAAPLSDNDAANKLYVDSVATGLKVDLTPATVATVGPLPASTYTGTPTYEFKADVNGALPAIDGRTLVVNDRILVKDQVIAKDNGVFKITAIGDGANPWVLRRARFNDPSGPYLDPGDYIFVDFGTVNVGTAWVLSYSTGGFVVDIDDQSWHRFSTVTNVIAGVALTEQSGKIFDVNVDDLGIEVNGSDQLTLKNAGVKKVNIDFTNFNLDDVALGAYTYLSVTSPTNAGDGQAKLDTRLNDLIANGTINLNDGVGTQALYPGKLDLLYDNVGVGVNGVNQLFLKNSGVKNNNLDKINIPLSGFGTAVADLNLGARKITNLAEPAANADAATKNYTDNEIAALSASNGVQRIGDDFSVKLDSNSSLLTTASGLKADSITVFGNFPTAGRLVDSVIVRDYIDAAIDAAHVSSTYEDLIVNDSDSSNPSAGFSISFLSTTGSGTPGGNLAAGTIMAELKEFIAKNIAGGSYTLSIASLKDAQGNNAAGLTFNSTGQAASLIWTGTNWCIRNAGAVVF